MRADDHMVDVEMLAWQVVRDGASFGEQAIELLCGKQLGAQPGNGASTCRSMNHQPTNCPDCQCRCRNQVQDFSGPENHLMPLHVIECPNRENVRADKQQGENKPHDLARVLVDTFPQFLARTVNAFVGAGRAQSVALLPFTPGCDNQDRRSVGLETSGSVRVTHGG